MKYWELGLVTRNSGGADGHFSSYYILTAKLINFNNGGIWDLNKMYVNEILAKDPELLSEFKKESSKKEKLQDYIIKYSTKHKDEIKR